MRTKLLALATAWAAAGAASAQTQFATPVAPPVAVPPPVVAACECPVPVTAPAPIGAEVYLPVGVYEIPVAAWDRIAAAHGLGDGKLACLSADDAVKFKGMCDAVAGPRPHADCELVAKDGWRVNFSGGIATPARPFGYCLELMPKLAAGGRHVRLQAQYEFTPETPATDGPTPVAARTETIRTTTTLAAGQTVVLPGAVFTRATCKTLAGKQVDGSEKVRHVLVVTPKVMVPEAATAANTPILLPIMLCELPAATVEKLGKDYGFAHTSGLTNECLSAAVTARLVAECKAAAGFRCLSEAQVVTTDDRPATFTTNGAAKTAFPYRVGVELLPRLSGDASVLLRVQSQFTAVSPTPIDIGEGNTAAAWDTQSVQSTSQLNAGMACVQPGAAFTRETRKTVDGKEVVGAEKMQLLLVVTPKMTAPPVPVAAARDKQIMMTCGVHELPVAAFDRLGVTYGFVVEGKPNTTFLKADELTKLVAECKTVSGYDLLSQPQMVGTDGKSALFSVAQLWPTPSRSGPQHTKIGSQLELRPTVSADGNFIRLGIGYEYVYPCDNGKNTRCPGVDMQSIRTTAAVRPGMACVVPTDVFTREGSMTVAGHKFPRDEKVRQFVVIVPQVLQAPPQYAVPPVLPSASVAAVRFAALPVAENPPRAAAPPMMPSAAPVVRFIPPLPSALPPAVLDVVRPVPVFMVTAPTPAAPLMVTKVFPVADLVAPGGGKQTSVEIGVKLAKLVTGMVRPHSWDVLGGKGNADYFDFGTSLVVNNKPDVIHEVEDLLASIRKLEVKKAVEFEITVVTLPSDAACLPKAKTPGETMQMFTAVERDAFLKAARAERHAVVTRMPKVAVEEGRPAKVKVCDTVTYTTGFEPRAGKDGLPVPVKTPYEFGVTCEVMGLPSADGRFMVVELGSRIQYLGGSIELIPVTRTITPEFLGGGRGQPIPFTQFIERPTITSEINSSLSASVADGLTMIAAVGRTPTKRTHTADFFAATPYLNRLFAPVTVDGEDVVIVLATPRVVRAAAEPACPVQAACCVEPACPVSPAAKLVAAYKAACAAGKTAEAMTLAVQALAADPACFAGGAK